jgi:hypothetical protein
MAYLIGQASKKEIDFLSGIFDVVVLTKEQIVGLFGPQQEDDERPEGEAMIMVYVDHDVSAILDGTNWNTVKAYAETMRFLDPRTVPVRDGDDVPYVLTECECDNTHKQNGTVCRWCMAQNATKADTKT